MTSSTNTIMILTILNKFLVNILLNTHANTLAYSVSTPDDIKIFTEHGKFNFLGRYISCHRHFLQEVKMFHLRKMHLKYHQPMNLVFIDSNFLS